MRDAAFLITTILMATAAGCGGHRSSSSGQASTQAPVTSGAAAVSSASAPEATLVQVNGQAMASLGRVMSSPVEVAYALRDQQGDVSSVAVEFSLDGQTWSAATRATGRGDATRGLLPTPTGVVYLFSWDARHDLGAASALPWIRVTPSDSAAGLAAQVRLDLDLSGVVVANPTTPAPTTPAPSAPAPTTPAPTTPAPTTPAPAPPATGPFVSALFPTLGARGRTVRIRGTGFSPVISENEVRFDGTPAMIVLARADELVVSSPRTLPLGSSRVTVRTRGQLGPISHSFRFLADVRVASLNPPSSWTGQQITIRGSDFDTGPNGVVVRFAGGVSVIATARSTSEIDVVVPAGASTGSVYVVTHGARSNSIVFAVVTGSMPPPAPAPTAPAPTAPAPTAPAPTAPAPTSPAPPAPAPSAPSNTAPEVVSVGSLSGVQSGAIRLSYTGRDAESDRVRVEAEYGVGFGPWMSARPHVTSDPTQNVLAAAGGSTYVFAWDSLRDLGTTSGPRSVRLRIRLVDAAGAASAWRSVPAFVVSNAAAPSLPTTPGNAVPDVLNVGSPSGTQGAQIVIPFTVADRESDVVEVQVRYMRSALHGWQVASPHSTSGSMQGLQTSASGQAYRFVWDARRDLGALRLTSMIVQVRARDASGVWSVARTTQSFGIDTR
jgi:IPT/TIG domain-containing protein